MRPGNPAIPPTHPAIRPAEAADLPALSRMLEGQTPWRELGFDAAGCLALVGPHLQEIQVAVDAGGVPLGFLRWRAEALLRQPYLLLLAVAPLHRGMGVGTALLAWLEREVFEARGAANLFLCVSSFNAPARAFYSARGYEEAGILRDYLRAGMDEILLRKTRRPLLGEG